MNILFHICCGNCAIYPFKLLQEEGHKFTGFWFNPNIQPYEEYQLRLDSLKGLADRWHVDMFYVDEYTGETVPDFQLQNENCKMKITDSQFPQSPRNRVVPTERCSSCYMLRLEKTAEEAQKRGFDAFSTTLLISPYQDFNRIITTGKELRDKYDVHFYLRDFRSYFRASMAFGKEMGLYRQKYCGCIYSREERRKKSR